MEGIIQTSSGQKIDIKHWDRLYCHEKRDEQSLEKFVQGKLGDDWERILIAGDFLYNYLKQDKPADRIEVGFLSKARTGFRYGSIERTHYLFEGTRHIDDANDPGVTTDLYSVRFPKDNKTLIIYNWEEPSAITID